MALEANLPWLREALKMVSEKVLQDYGFGFGGTHIDYKIFEN